MTENSRKIGWYLMFAGLPLLVYLNSLQNPLHYDDVHSIVENPHIRTLSNIPAFFADPTLFSKEPDNAMYRPLLLTTFAVNHAVSGYEVWSYHLVGIVLHLVCVILVGAIGKRLMGSEKAAGLAALVFGLHPIHTEPINYISSRSEVLAGCFMLLGFWAFLRRRQQEEGLGLLAAAFAAGLLSKSIAIVLPVLLLAYDLIFFRERVCKDLKLYGVLAGIALLYLSVVWRFLKKASIGEPVRSYPEQVWSQVKALVLYTQLLLWPSGQSVDHQFLISDTLFDPFAASAFLFVLSLFFLGVYHMKRHPLPLFLLIWFVVTLAPSSLVPLNVLVNEHRLYVPSAAFGLLAGYCCKRVVARGKRWEKVCTAVAVAVLAGLAGATVKRNQAWESVYTLWGDAARKAPLMARPYIYLGEAYVRDGRQAEGIVAFERVVQRDPGFAPAYVHLGKLYREQGRNREAEKILRKGLEEEPENPDLWSYLGDVYRVQRQWAECLRAYQEAARLGPENDALHNNLGNAYQMLDEPREALIHHQRALEINPDDARTWLNLGNAYTMLGEHQKAFQAYQGAVARDSLFAGAWLNLGHLYEKLGQEDAALEAYDKSAQLDPGYAGFVEERRRALTGGRE